MDTREIGLIKSSDKLLEISSRMDHFDNKMGDKHKTVAFGGVNIPNSFLPLSNSSSTSSLSSNKSRKASDIERTISYIQQNFKVLVLMRGLPGSGKSTLAKKILESTIGYDETRTVHLLSTDDYFRTNKLGVYNYDATKIESAHGWNQNRAFQSMSRGFSPVIIDNTNVQMWEMKPYATMATDYGYIIEILEADTHWCFDDKELSKRNTHGVPRAKIRDMLERYDKNITARKLLSAYNLYYKLQKPPQLRLYPPPNNIATTNRYKQNNNEPSIKPETATLLNHQTEKTKPIETINLMEFDDEVTTKPKEATCNSPCEPNPVDKILMFSNDIEATKVLKPQQNQNDTVKSVLNAWGVDEIALRSWDFVTPVKDERNLGCTIQTPVEVNKVIMIESGTNTEDEYFHLLKKVNVSVYPSGITVLDTLNRDINRNTPQRTSLIPKKLMLDKSCMTEGLYEDYENHMTQLESLFPDVPSTYLQYWYKKCQRDLEWTIEFLLEAKDEITTLIEKHDEENELEDKNVSDEDNNSDNNQPFQVKESRRRKRKISEESNNLIKLIESKIDINSDHYSEHLRRIKNRQKGNSDSAIPSTSSANCEDNVRQRTSSNESSTEVDSDIEVDEVDVLKSARMEETIELNLGEHFVAQLEEKFGEPSLSYPKGFQPVVQMPASLARQLYTFYLESVYQQMDNQKQILEEMAKEDEEFAKKLQASEFEESRPLQPDPTPNLQEIMEGQRQYNKEVEKWKNMNPDNLALKLTREKLINSFPTINQDTLIEILFAYENKYAETVESLLASMEPGDVQGNVENIKEPPIQEEVLEEMKEAQRGNTNQEYDEVQQATFYREQANKFQKRREELYKKAQKYCQKGMKEVAQFYSGLASQQTDYFERANSMAATAFLDEHFKRLQDFNTLDLHFLYVKEAIPALDMFLDRAINLLRSSKEKQSEYLQIITGRGKNSQNGVAKIKPVVQARLKKRDIKFVQLNPGLLKVKVTKTTLITNEMPLN
ncbi:unnamed protein product [Acanthoscelides obtectus]|uniref:Smr domain-containing protein n=1 Tax=Acanthoscelides obtectus TaxID=200917 RepID=A0A9P0P1F4_ACAOB|nr:unnamed protein product [Acanthoscelides obtectus]CAK1638125.1 NEDD4-binding protein 2-like 1 [Acanthoscelides obtectus]